MIGLSLLLYVSHLRSDTMMAGQAFSHRYYSPFQRSRLLVQIALTLKENSGVTKSNEKKIEDLLYLAGSGLQLEPTDMGEILKGVALARAGCNMRDAIDSGRERRNDEPDNLYRYIEASILLLLSHESAVRDVMGHRRVFTSHLPVVMERVFGDSVIVRADAVKIPVGKLKSLEYDEDLSGFFEQSYSTKYREILLEALRGVRGDFLSYSCARIFA